MRRGYHNRQRTAKRHHRSTPAGEDADCSERFRSALGAVTLDEQELDGASNARRLVVLLCGARIVHFPDR